MSVSGAASTAVSIGRLHIVSIAALGTLTFGWLFTGRYLWALVATCAVDWFVVNLLNRVVDLEEDQANQIRGTAFVARHRRAIFAVGLALLIGTVVLTHLFEPNLTPLRLSYHLLGFAYNWPLIPWFGRIKQRYFWKNTASALGFMITVFAYPLATVGWGLDPAQLPAGISLSTILFAGVFFFLFELSYEVIYDLRDAKGDALAGVRTYPVVHGEATKIADHRLDCRGLGRHPHTRVGDCVPTRLLHHDLAQGLRVGEPEIEASRQLLDLGRHLEAVTDEHHGNAVLLVSQSDLLANADVQWLIEIGMEIK